MFRKFTKLYMVLLFFLIIVGGINIFMVDEPSDQQQNQLENKVTQTTPGYSTMTTIAQISTTHLLENAILDIQVTPTDDKEDVLLQLQTSEFLTEDMLLKNTYNMLQDIQKIETIDTFTFAWYMLIKSENTEVLALTLDREGLNKVVTTSYQALPTIATDYKKHEVLQ
ncbi:hypothetical protein AAGS61_19740 [Lysinibacillus sp. KU-BSD001]|uniref:hypothetical protein n=1 Tax=Lysinibacillus sp. KU-BSD001 TaxID=3141328 RepID=UPI0036E16A7D